MDISVITILLIYLYQCKNVFSYITFFSRDPRVPSEVQQEGDIQYKYEVYEKI